MTNKHLTFAIFGNSFQPRKSQSLMRVLDFLRSKGASIIFDRTFYDFLTAEQNQELGEVGTFEGDDFNADYVISMGGDGTFLKAAVRVGIKSIPLIGINMGRLGFLADVLPGEVETALQAVLEGNYNIEEHTAIQISTNGGDFDGCHYALNDIAVLKRDIASMIGIHTSIDGSFLVNYQADGLIVSTPTGSTAYSLSNGGPIIVPQTRTLCLTPVAPHSLNIRPIVISDSSTVTLEVESRSHNYLVAVDGRSYTMHEGSTVTISKAPFVTRIVKPNGRRYFSSLRDKMMWGADKR
ncbi:MULTISPECIES: NAD kinase [Prevotella]|jgi:NAD+ kinase|uniref:NAD kinase n=1 Tax=Prevotella TaxID=838 RepID=UPI000D0FBEF9|nr:MULTISPECIES: NAD kinase [Prevotella]MEE0669798.1 NAD kinase [Prevotella sp.]